MNKQFTKHNQNPLVSVIIPVYNGAPFLAETIHSVQQSTFTDFEIILIDDGSKDASREMCQAFAKLYDNVRFHGFDENRGLGRVLNWGLENTRGTYICRINQDDEMTPDRIQKQVDFLNTHQDVVLVGSWLLVEDENGDRRINRFLKDDAEIKKSWLYLSPCWDASVMYRRDSAVQVGGYIQSFWPADDLHMWYRLGKVGKIANIQEPLVKIKFHTAAASVKHHNKHMVATYEVHRWAHNNVERAPLLTQLFWLGELMAGYLLPARVNWIVYRFIKKYIVYRTRMKLPRFLPQVRFGLSQ